MHSLLYMLARTVVTYTLFRGTRGMMKIGSRHLARFPDRLKLWECPECLKMWSGDSDGTDECDYCGSKLVAKHYRPEKEDPEEEIIMVA